MQKEINEHLTGKKQYFQVQKMLRKVVKSKSVSKSYAYKMGYDCGKNGATTKNAHFTIFSSPEKRVDWEQGKRDAEARKRKGKKWTSKK